MSEKRKYTEDEIIEAGLNMYLCSLIHHTAEYTPYIDFESEISSALKHIRDGSDYYISCVERCRRDAERGYDITRWKTLLGKYRDEIGLKNKEYLAAQKKNNDSEEEWITIHPNGPGTKGVAVPIDESGDVQTKWGKKEDVTLPDAESVPIHKLKKEHENIDKTLVDSGLPSVSDFTGMDSDQKKNVLLKRQLIPTVSQFYRDRSTMNAFYKRYAETLNEFGKIEKNPIKSQFYQKGKAVEYLSYDFRGDESISTAYDQLYHYYTSLTRDKFIERANEIYRFTQSVHDAKSTVSLRDEFIDGMDVYYDGTMFRGLCYQRRGNSTYQVEREELDLIVGLQHGLFTNEYNGSSDTASFAHAGNGGVCSNNNEADATLLIHGDNDISDIADEFARPYASDCDSFYINCIHNRTGVPIGGLSYYGVSENEVLTRSNTVQKVISVEVREKTGGDGFIAIATTMEVPVDDKGDLIDFTPEEPLFISSDPRYNSFDDLIEEISKRNGKNLVPNDVMSNGLFRKLLEKPFKKGKSVKISRKPKSFSLMAETYRKTPKDHSRLTKIASDMLQKELSTGDSIEWMEKSSGLHYCFEKTRTGTFVLSDGYDNPYEEQIAELSPEDSAEVLMSIANLFASNEVKYKKAGKGNHTDAISRFHKRRAERMRKH